MQGRQVHLGEWSEVGPEKGRTTLTPNANAARALGVGPLSLETLARQILGDERIAHPLTTQRLLRDAVGEALGSPDPDGAARVLLPPARELFRAEADLEADPGSPRARRVTEVARGYRALLRGEGLIDPAEALWEAAKSPPARIPVFVWGYPRLGLDEAAFVDAVAGEDSVLRLPHAEDYTFQESAETAEGLEGRGWAVERTPAKASWNTGVSIEACAYPHLEAEVRGALARVKVLLAEGVPRHDIVLVARDDAFYGPTVLSVTREKAAKPAKIIPYQSDEVGGWGPPGG